MSPSKVPPEKILEQAEKKVSGAKSWSLFSSSSTKYEEASELFEQAAASFKVEKNFVQAGDAFSKQAECMENYGDSNGAANAWWNASKSYKAAQRPDLAVGSLEQSIQFLLKTGRFRQAADRQKDIAQIHLLDECRDERLACESFEKAGEWYQQEDAHAMANGCLKDAADLHAQIGNFSQAIVLYEQIANYSLQSSLTKYSVKEYWLRSGLCALANRDSVTARRNFDRHNSTDPAYGTTREAKFLGALIEIVEQSDLESFSTACRDFDQISKLDNWKTQILLKIKESINESLDEGPAIL